MAKPVIKWAGGKTYLLGDIEEILTGFGTDSYKYCEPMVGGGAVFYRLASRFKSSVISDLNPDLINLYRVVQSDVDALIAELCNGEYFYVHKSDSRTLENYRRIRAEEPTNSVKRAARIVFLLKTCFNGLMRVNKQGRFNVPPGSYRNPTICDEPVLRDAAAALAHTSIKGPGDAATLIRGLRGKYFLFVDPPYHGGNDSKFTGYSGAFGDEQQADLVKAMLGSDCPFIYTNRATDFILDLFDGSGAELKTVDLKHSIQPRYTTGLIESELIAYRI